MAKKRVHEIAKERGISSKEVLAILQKAGFDVKAAASSVDEGDIAKAFGGDADGANGADASNGADAAPAAPGAAQAAPAPREGAPPPDPQAGQPGDAQPAQRPQRPTRGTPPGRGGPGGRHRRVVIDSQASRRPQGPPPPQQPRRRGRGRRRRTPWVEPDLNAPPEPVKEEPPVRIKSGATVKEVAESLSLGSPEVIKKLMELR